MTEIMALSDIVRVYRGRSGCMCGCRGKYIFAKAYAHLSKGMTGYEADPEDISDRKVKNVYKFFLENRKDFTLFEEGAYFYEEDRKVIAIWTTGHERSNRVMAE
jgi:hypothetical protein